MSTTKDMLNGYSALGVMINEFLYEGKVKKGVKQEHTKEELEEMLENVRRDCWDYYSNATRELGIR